jgi:hypothetical protein
LLTRIPEQTKGYTLEQMGAAFGDDVVDDQGHLERAEEYNQQHKLHTDVEELEVAKN